MGPKVPECLHEYCGCWWLTKESDLQALHKAEKMGNSKLIAMAHRQDRQHSHALFYIDVGIRAFICTNQKILMCQHHTFAAACGSTGEDDGSYIILFWNGRIQKFMVKVMVLERNARSILEGISFRKGRNMDQVIHSYDHDLVFIDIALSLLELL